MELGNKYNGSANTSKLDFGEVRKSCLNFALVRFKLIVNIVEDLRMSLTLEVTRLFHSFGVKGILENREILQNLYIGSS